MTCKTEKYIFGENVDTSALTEMPDGLECSTLSVENINMVLAELSKANNSITVDSVDEMAAIEQLSGVIGISGVREGVFYFNTDDLSAEVSADTCKGMYVAPSCAPSGASGAWVRLYDDYIMPEWFGAVGDGSTDDHEAFACAFAMQDLTGLQIHTKAETYYDASLHSLTHDNVSVVGQGVDVSAVIAPAGWIDVTHSDPYDTFIVRDLAILTDEDATATAIKYVGGYSGGNANTRIIENVHIGGFDYWSNRQSTAPANRNNSFEYGLHLTEADNISTIDIHVFGAENDVNAAGNWGSNTVGVYAEGTTHLSLERFKSFFNETGVQLRGSSENMIVEDSTIVAVNKGIDFSTDTGLAYDHNIKSTHINAHTYCVNLGDGGDRTGALRHNIEGCYFLKRIASTYAGFKHLIVDTGHTTIIGNTFDNAPNDSVNLNDIAIDIKRGLKHIIMGNTFVNTAYVLQTATGVDDVTIIGNQTVDGGISAPIDPLALVHSTAAINTSLNYGDRENKWLANMTTSLAMEFWTRATNMFFYNGADRQLNFRIGDGTGAVVNNLAVEGSATGLDPRLEAEGADADIDIVLVPKGDGLVRFNTPTTATGDVPVTSYIEIKDGFNNTIKLAVID